MKTPLTAMTLHIFNPEHDLVLAANTANFTAPHAVRELKSGLGFIPALWASDGDAVLVEDRDYAAKALKRACVQADIMLPENVLFIEAADLSSVSFSQVAPWGWDVALRNYLLRHRVDKQRLPDLEQLDELRMLSHRLTSCRLLESMSDTDGLTGQSFACSSLDEVSEHVKSMGQAVIKMPWSCSGRGLRFVDNGDISEPHLYGWIRNALTTQDSLMVEPYYRKVKDFGMEFFCGGDGRVSYKGLSLFSTVNGAYTGNIIATESAKLETISRYVPDVLLENIKESICNFMSGELAGRYTGPFGVDMMVVSRTDRDGFLVHPCVEVNLRRTMGHVALSLSPTDDDIKRVMRITANDNYQLKIRPL